MDEKEIQRVSIKKKAKKCVDMTLQVRKKG